MKIRKLENAFLVRLERGDEVISSLTTLAEQENIEGAFLHGLGGAEKAVIGLYRIDTDKEYHYKEFSGELEIISMNGNIARDEDGNVMVHCHTTISGEDLAVSGGHAKELVVAGTCEIFLDTRTGTLKRVHDEDIGLKLLDL